MRALIASGSGRYADPWHPYPVTSRGLATVLGEAGFEVTIDDDVDHALSSLAGYDLLVVNAGDPWRNTDDEAPAPGPTEPSRGLDEALDRGIGVLALHAAVASLRDYPGWAPAIGAIWIPGASWHPPAGSVRIVRASDPASHAVVGDFGDFEVHDERYLQLQPTGRRTVLAQFEHDGVDHPAIWVRRYRNSRIAVDLLGHDERSYEAEGHRLALQHLARWAAAS